MKVDKDALYLEYHTHAEARYAKVTSKEGPYYAILYLVLKMQHNRSTSQVEIRLIESEKTQGELDKMVAKKYLEPIDGESDTPTLIEAYLNIAQAAVETINSEYDKSIEDAVLQSGGSNAQEESQEAGQEGGNTEGQAETTEETQATTSTDAEQSVQEG